MEKKTIVVAGATGQQGGAVLASLAGKGFHLKGLTRKTDSAAAKALADKGVELVRADFDDEASLRAALAGAWGAFAVQTMLERGVEGEEEQGKRFARVAREAGVQRFVYTSVGSAQHKTAIPHFESKWHVEEEVRALGFASWAVLRPVFFMENLLAPWALQGDKLMYAMKPERRLQMVAVADIGRVGALLFEQAERYAGAEIDLAGDERTLPEAAAILSARFSRPIEFVSVPVDAVRAMSEDMAIMFEWFDRVGYSVDIAGLEKSLGFGLTRLEGWAEALASR